MNGVEEGNTARCSAKLRELLNRVSVYSADHVIWIDCSDEIHLDPVPEKMSPEAWEDLNRDRIKFALPPLKRGRGGIGPLAARDEKWLQELCSTIDAHRSPEVRH